MAATTTPVSIEEYLNTIYHPDFDYVQGEIEERNLGEWEHGKLQAIIGSYFVVRRREWNLHVSTEQRIRVKSDRVRIPDVCVVLGPEPRERVLSTPPFLCIEVLSPEDRKARVLKRIADFLDFGVLYVWLIDPQTRQAWVFTAQSEIEVADGILVAGHIIVPIDELFD